MGKRLKVLYVCPFAHHPGHYSRAAVEETSGLAKAGAEVVLLTFQDFAEEQLLRNVQHLLVIPKGKARVAVRRFLNTLRMCGVGRILALAVEFLLTLLMSLRLKRRLKCDIIHLRDGDAFPFMPHVLGVFTQDSRWVVSLVSWLTPGAAPSRLLGKVLKAKAWRPIYEWSMARNRYLFLFQNDVVRQYHERNFLDGMLVGKTAAIPLSVWNEAPLISREEARRHLRLPLESVVLLSFGAYHSGKDLDTVFCALKNIEGVLLVHAGATMPSTEVTPAFLAQKYGLAHRVIVNDRYISQGDKAYYFASADAVILSYKNRRLATASMLWEACRCRRPVIASNSGQLGELVREHELGLLFQAQDSDSLREAILRFLRSSQEEREEMEQNCERFCAKFPPEKWAQRCLQIYGGLLRAQ